MTTAEQTDYKQYEGKKVLLDWTDGETRHEKDKGKLEVAAPEALIFKPHGKSSVELIDISNVHGIELAPVEEKELKARRVNPITLDSAKRHLVDWHGYNLADVNAMSSERAFAFHEDEIDHTPLGHFHAEAASKEEAEASE